MDKVQNQLFLNYKRPLGRTFSLRYSGSNETKHNIPTGMVHVFPEILVPGSSDNENSMLTAIANSLFLEARSHNMSLAPYGHLDPAKFAIAGTFIGILLEEILGDLSVIGAYSFGNALMGELLPAARDIHRTSSETDFANICKKVNMVIAKANSLYIPVTGFLKRWYEHRRYIYKDDEGDRYSLYTYWLANYYELDVDPESPTVGQLICNFRIHGAIVDADVISATDIMDKIDRLDQLIGKYLGDDDIANFCTEALNAGLPHVTFQPLKSTTTTTADGDKVEKFVGPELKLKYSLDDILGLENAYFVAPTVLMNSRGPAGKLTTWNIVEDAGAGVLYCGSCKGDRGKLPVFGKADNWDPLSLGNAAFDLAFTPIFTHAKVTSLPGLTNLLRYVVQISPSTTWTNFENLPNKVIYFNGDSNGATTGLTNARIAAIDVHGTELLSGHVSICYSPNGNGIDFYKSRRFGQVIFGGTEGEAFELLCDEATINIGFKARFVTYVAVSGDIYSPIISDFDYITTVSADALTTFFGANAWNDVQIIKSSEIQTGSSENNSSEQ